jgi:hypothetical protein
VEAVVVAPGCDVEVVVEPAGCVVLVVEWVVEVDEEVDVHEGMGVEVVGAVDVVVECVVDVDEDVVVLEGLVVEVVGTVDVVVECVVEVEEDVVVLDGFVVDVELELVVDAPGCVVVVVVVPASWTSTEPMSHAPPDGRGSERWSTDGQKAAAPMLTSGLLFCGRCVQVKPPLFCSTPISGFVLFLSPAPAKAQVASFERLEPPDVIVPEQLPPVFALSAVFRTVVPPDPRRPGRALLLTVTFVRVSDPALW